MAERKHKIVFHQQEIAAMYDRIIGNDNNLSIYMKMIQLVKAGAFEDLGLSRDSTDYGIINERELCLWF